MIIKDTTKFVNAELWNKKIKEFAHRHGLLESELGKQESRTMAYRVNYPGRAKRIKYARKMYGDPKKWVQWAESDGTKARPKN